MDLVGVEGRVIVVLWRGVNLVFASGRLFVFPSSTNLYTPLPQPKIGSRTVVVFASKYGGRLGERGAHRVRNVLRWCCVCPVLKRKSFGSFMVL